MSGIVSGLSAKKKGAPPIGSDSRDHWTSLSPFGLPCFSRLRTRVQFSIKQQDMAVVRIPALSYPSQGSCCLPYATRYFKCSETKCFPLQKREGNGSHWQAFRGVL
ncbi:hypothetical protein PanWU01x14_372140 [Parasponia andersonii]|uniref:Uncharacterized protein n=1 Tax=Parasponia andersonii TaxID=3476 RepID=A0A2P5A3P4_PARAD|nr:hypothetical protein PanWU01x14_372140 [Parasponia andersonii]